MGLSIPDASLEMRASDFAEKLAVSRAENIIALMPQRKDGERTDENLIITELCCIDKNKKNSVGSPVLPNSDPVIYVPADTQKVEHKVDKTLFANIETPAPKTDKKTYGGSSSDFELDPVGYQRDYESFSSLSELINQPFDYVLDYIYNMKDEDEGSLSTIEGNVAHDVIDQMVKECTVAKGNVDTSMFLNLCKDVNKLEERTEHAALNVGAVLLQPENEMEYNIFKHILTRKSIPVLAKIIEDNALEFVGTEVEYTNILKDSSDNDVFNYNAKIDCLLKRNNPDTNGLEYLIFDFKWTGTPNKRKEELEHCKELQLALYQKIAETNKLKPIVMRGYYLLKQAQLLTTNDVFKPNDAIVIVEQKNKYDIFEQAVASYRERINNLKNGFIEEGEEMKGPNFIGTKFIDKYYQAPINYYLHNNLSAKKDGMKAEAKDSTYGKNSVLKGKIK